MNTLTELHLTGVGTGKQDAVLLSGTSKLVGIRGAFRPKSPFALRDDFQRCGTEPSPHAPVKTKIQNPPSSHRLPLPAFWRRAIE